jgi:hypothetical protein
MSTAARPLAAGRRRVIWPDPRLVELFEVDHTIVLAPMAGLGTVHQCAGEADCRDKRVSSTALSSNEGELARSITTCAPARASFSPSPVMVLTPLLGAAARTSWPPWRTIATVFETIRPEPPITTIFMVGLPYR